MSVFNQIKPGNMINRLGDGGMPRVLSQIKDAIPIPSAPFSRMIVLDVVHDPQIIDDNKIDYWRNVIKVTNIRFAKILPRNTIIAQPATTSVTRIAPPMFMLPFFPSHLALPCKPGEMVWTIFENPNADIKEMGYWICRITEPHFVDDVNHTHHALQLDQSMQTSIKKKMDGENKPIYELRNGKTTATKDGIRSTVADSKLIQSDDESVFEKLVTDSDAAQITQYESVPRFRKRPGDVVLEGSNNTLIVLGTDRLGKVAEASLDSSAPSRGITPQRVLTDFFGYSGAIDLVAGRGATPVTGGTVASTKRIADGQELKKEILKTPEGVTRSEGDPDFSQDRSRLLISQRTSTDQNFGLKDYMNKKFNNTVVDDSQGDASIVIKSDKVRIIARSDISFIVTNFEKIPGTDSQTIKSSTTDATQWASITIKVNGDIIFTPSDKGYIKLGGDDAKQAIICTANPASTSDGLVKSLPIASTAGGFIGTTGGNVDSSATAGGAAPDMGTFSKKVLIK